MNIYTRQKLTAVINEHLSLGSHRTNFGKVRPPAGYDVLSNPDGTHYYWVCHDGRESVIHWDRWAAYRGAKVDAERRDNDAASEMFEDEICSG